MLVQPLHEEINIGHENDLLLPYCSFGKSARQKAAVAAVVRIAWCAQNAPGPVWRLEEQFWVLLQLVLPWLVDQYVFGRLRAREGQRTGANADNIAVAFVK